MGDTMTNQGLRTAEIISLKCYRSTMQHHAISQLEAYWQGLRCGRLVPNRSDVDPRGIETALEFAFILERISPGMARFRLAGMHLNELMGMEVRGMPITAFFAPDTRRQVSDALEHVFEEPALARISLRGERGMGRSPITAELIILPLRSDLGDISRALGCLVCDGEIGRTPRRFDVCDLQLEPLFAGVAPRGAPLRVAPASPMARRCQPTPPHPWPRALPRLHALRDAPPIQTGDDMPEATARDNGEGCPQKAGQADPGAMAAAGVHRRLIVAFLGPSGVPDGGMTFPNMPKKKRPAETGGPLLFLGMGTALRAPQPVAFPRAAWPVRRPRERPVPAPDWRSAADRRPCGSGWTDRPR